jgi:sporulation-control protein
MSMFKKILASVGIGAAKVDTRLFQDALTPGEMVSGEVHIVGGDVAQNVDDIYIYIVTEYKQEVDDRTVTRECELLKYCLAERFELQPKQTKVIPFSVQLPYETPLTIGHQPVYVRTGLDISSAIDPKDKDYLQVHPHPLVRQVLNAVENLGFQLHKVDCEYAKHFGSRYPFMQEFEFRATGKYRSQLDELEVIFLLHPDELQVFLQIDRKARGFGGLLREAFDMDESYARISVTPAYLQRPQELAALIDRTIQSHLH